MDYWIIWLYGTNYYTSPQTNSQVLMRNMPDEAKVIGQVPTAWYPIRIIALDPDDVPLREPDVRNGIPVHCTTQIREYNLQSVDYLYPEEFDELNDLTNIFKKNYIYLSVDGPHDEIYQYPETDNRIHEVDSCLLVAMKGNPSPKHGHEYGTKSVSVELQNFYPITS